MSGSLESQTDQKVGFNQIVVVFPDLYKQHTCLIINARDTANLTRLTFEDKGKPFLPISYFKSVATSVLSPLIGFHHLLPGSKAWSPGARENEA